MGKFIINAAQASQLTIESLLKSIEKSAREGERSIIVQRDIHSQEKYRLEKLGFCIEDAYCTEYNLLFPDKKIKYGIRIYW